MNRRNILIAGGDIRQIYCGERLSRDFTVSYAGFDKSDITSANEKYGCVVLPVPPPDSTGKIYTPLWDKSLYIADIKALLTDDALIFAGTNPDKTAEFFPYHKVYSYAEQEAFSLKNAISTAEGAILLALQELPVTLSGLPVLIVGMGRIGTALANILKGFGADITAAVRNGRGAAKAALLGVKAISTDDITGNFSLVFNTAPNLIFTEELIADFPENTLFIDLASKPGGFDFKGAEAMGRKVIHALGLPAKKAPVTAGYDVADTIIDIINERGKCL